MTLEHWLGVAAIVVTLMGITVVPAWRAMGSRVERVNKDLSDHKLHVAESYATKEGMAHMEKTLVGAVTDVGDRLDKRLDRMTDRLDRVIEHENQPRKIHHRD